MRTFFSLFFLFIFLHSYAYAQINTSEFMLGSNIYSVNNNLNISANNQLAMLPTTDRKDPLTAVLLSALWPGIGQFYVGEPIKGTLMTVGQISLLVPLIDAMSAAKTEKYGDTNKFRAEIILALMIGNLVYSVIDAGNTARSLNYGEGLSLQLYNSNYLPNSMRKNISNDICAKISLKVSL